MYIFRIFAVSVLIPLISVGLCATGESNSKPRHKTVLVSEVKPRSPEVSHEKIGSESSSHQHKEEDSLPYHPHPLKLDIRSIIKNSTRVDENLFAEARGIHDYDHELDTLSWIWSFLWKAVSSYLIVATLNLIISPLLKKFGYGGPYWETSISLGSHKDDKEEEKPGWGWDAGAHHHPTGGWLGWDQLQAIPFVDKYSLKAAKKAMHYQKKAQKFAQKANKYAAKAALAKLQVKAPYPGSFLQHGYGGWPAPGWGGKKH